MNPSALILYANGTNRDSEAAFALEKAGAQPEIVPLTVLRRGERQWRDYQMLVLPGGFAYADALGAGKLLALDLKVYFADAVNEFVAGGKPVIGICNGFQTLVKAGLLPAPTQKSGGAAATLAHNASGRFECRWVTLSAQSRKCIWTRDLDDLIDCPVAHGEGNFTLADPARLAELHAGDQIALRYTGADGSRAGGEYPVNPNGSLDDIAGVCNPQGNVLGLMPHPEDHLFPYQHPQHTRGVRGRLGLHLFQNGVRYAAQS